MELNLNNENGQATTSDSASGQSITYTIKQKKNTRSYKTEYEKLIALNNKLTNQRNIAVGFAAGTLLIDILYKIFS